jgi:hypothetical protein
MTIRQLLSGPMSLWLPVITALLLLVAMSAQSAEYQLSEEPPPESVEKIPEPLGQLGEDFLRDPRVIFKPINDWRRTRGPFLRDGQLVFNFRTYYFDAEKPNGTDPRVWAGGGELAYNSGKWRDFLSVGASWYGSYDWASNSDKEESVLLSSSGDNISVIGQAYLQTNWNGLIGRFYRQELDIPYINRFDNRMIPNTFEAYGFRRAGDQLDFVLKYVDKIKRRGDDSFVSMGEAAGVDGSDAGVTAVGFNWKSKNEDFGFGAVNQTTRDIFNTAYAEVRWKQKVIRDFALNLSAQYTDQRSIGDEELEEFRTNTWGVRATGGGAKAVATLAFTQTDEGRQGFSPYGGRPSYLSMMIRDFDRANERAWLAGVSYHFDDLGLPDLSAVVNYVRGRHARDPGTGAKLRGQTEVDYTLDYKPSTGIMKGFWFRARYARVDEDGLGKVTDELRLILNYSLPIL